MIDSKKMKLRFLFLPFLGLICFDPSHEADSSNGSIDVEIVSPRKGEQMHGKITIAAKVKPPGTVKFIDFYIQEPGAKDRYGWKSYRQPYFWGGGEKMLDTSLFKDGLASVVAFPWPRDKSWHDDKNRVFFTIDNGKPEIKIIKPKADEEITVMGDILIDVHASDAKGLIKPAGIRAVYIYADGKLMEKLIESPYQLRLNSRLLAPGRHSIQAVAEDSEGLTSTQKLIFTVKPEASCIVSDVIHNVIIICALKWVVLCSIHEKTYNIRCRNYHTYPARRNQKVV